MYGIGLSFIIICKVHIKCYISIIQLIHSCNSDRRLCLINYKCSLILCYISKCIRNCNLQIINSLCIPFHCIGSARSLHCESVICITICIFILIGNHDLVCFGKLFFYCYVKCDIFIVITVICLLQPWCDRYLRLCCIYLEAGTCYIV